MSLPLPAAFVFSALQQSPAGVQGAVSVLLADAALYYGLG